MYPWDKALGLTGCEIRNKTAQNSQSVKVQTQHLHNKPPVSPLGLQNYLQTYVWCLFFPHHTHCHVAPPPHPSFQPNSEISFNTFCLFLFCSFSPSFRKMYFYPTRAKCSSRDLMNRPNIQTHDLWVSSAPFITVETCTTAKCIGSLRIPVSVPGIKSAPRVLKSNHLSTDSDLHFVFSFFCIPVSCRALPLRNTKLSTLNWFLMLISLAVLKQKK